MLAVKQCWQSSSSLERPRGTLVGEAGAVGVAEMLDPLIEDIAPDAAALGCMRELMRCRNIARGGTSADTQLAVFDAHAHRSDKTRALRAVTDWIAAATLQ